MPKVSVWARTVVIAELIDVSAAVIVDCSGSRRWRLAKDQGRCVEGHAADGQRAGAGLVEVDRQVVAVEQVDAVVGSVAGQLIDLRQQRVVVALQRGARGAGSSHCAAGKAERRLVCARGREAGVRAAGGEHEMAAAVVGRRHGARAAEAGGAVDGQFDRAQRGAGRDRDGVGRAAAGDQEVAGRKRVALERSTVPVVEPAVSLAADCACCAVDRACCSRLVRLVRPLLAASRVCWACPI